MITKRLPGNSSADRILERQFRNRELASVRPGRNPRSAQGLREFICISQEFGSGGAALAAELGQRLHWPVFDKEILHAMARDDVSREQIYRSLDERDLGWFSEACRSLMDTQFRRNDYFHRLVQTVFCVARQAPTVFVGRGADLILPGDRGLRVRLVAPRKQRIANFARQNDLTEAEAAEEILRKERDRTDWIRNHFHVAADDNTRWDLVINLGRLTQRDGAELILSALRLRQTAEGSQKPGTS